MAKFGPGKCDVCARPGAIGFQLVRHVKNADGRWSSRSNGTIYLCHDCWSRGPAKRRMWRRGHGTSRSTLQRRRAVSVDTPGNPEGAPF